MKTNDAKVCLHRVQGFGRRTGVDVDGNMYREQFAGEIQDEFIDAVWTLDTCPSCDTPLHGARGPAERNGGLYCPHCRRDLIRLCADECAECDKLITGDADAWLCLDDGDLLHAEHMTVCCHEPEAHIGDVIGFTYEADQHCVMCAMRRFPDMTLGGPEATTDREGNPVSAIVWGNPGTSDMRCVRCGTCHGELQAFELASWSRE